MEHGGKYGTDGLFISGPARTGANTLFFLGCLMWSFLGVAIAADVFMAGIEKITSQETTKSVVLPSGEVRRHTLRVISRPSCSRYCQSLVSTVLLKRTLIRRSPSGRRTLEGVLSRGASGASARTAASSGSARRRWPGKRPSAGA